MTPRPAPTREPGSEPGPGPARGFNAAAHGLRGLAALGVLFAHMLGGVGQNVYHDHATYNAAVAPFWHLGTFGVFLFFVISGFVIWPSARRYGPGAFAWRRFVRLYPLFLAFSLLFVAANLAIAHEPHLNDPLTILAALTFTNLFTGTDQLTPNAWSLSYEVAFYALTALGVWVAFTLRSRVALALFAAVALAFVVLWPKALFFVGGLLVRWAHDRGWYPRARARLVCEAALLVATIVLAAAAKRSFHQGEFADPATWATLIATCAWFHLAVAPDSLAGRALANRVTAYLGVVSYSLYLAHPYTYFVAREAFERAGLFTADTVGSMTLFFAVVTAVTLPVTHAVYLVLERWPYEACFRRGVYEGAEKMGERRVVAAA